MRPLLALAALLLGTASALAEVPRVVVSTKPIHSLVAAVMGDLGTPDLLIKGAASPHSYSLKPSDAAALGEADIVFWTGHQFEVFLEDALAELSPNAKAVSLGGAPGITLLPPREGGSFDAHDDEGHAEAGHDEHGHEEEGHGEEGHEEEGHEEHGHEEVDMHTFLDPVNAKAMVDLIEKTLTETDPDNASTYAANAAAERAALDSLIAAVAARLAPVKDRPMVVFHDAYQYFEQRFGIDVVGSVTVSPENMPGADRISEVREKLKSLDAACVFAEPNFDSRIIEVLIEGTSARAGTLDPEGAALEPGKGLYDALITGLADNMVACLEQ